MPMRFGKSSLFCGLLFAPFLEYKAVAKGVSFPYMAEKDIESVGMEVRQLYEKGYGMLEKKQFEYAVELLTMAIEKEPAFFDCRVALRAAQISVSKGKGKIGRMAAVAAAAPHVAQAKVALARDNYFGALISAEKILNGDPENTVGHQIIVDASRMLDLPHTMISSLQLLKKLNPDDTSLTQQLATALEMLGDWDQAEELMGQLAAMNPDDPFLQQAYKDTAAKATIFRGNYESTVQDNPIESEPSEIMTAEESLEQRIYTMEERLHEEPENFKLGVDIAKLYVERRDFEAAFEYFDWVQENNQVSDSAIDRAILLAHQERFDYEIQQLKESAEVSAAEKERDEFMLQICQEFSDRYPTMLEFRFELGERLFRLGKVNEAIQTFQKTQVSPKHKLESLSYLGQCFMKRRMHDMALSQFEKALGEKTVMDQQRKELVYNLACVYEELGRREEAAKYFKEIYGVDIGFRDVADKVESGYSSGG